MPSASPKRYARGYSFSGAQANNPAKPLPAQHVDGEFDNVSQSINGLVDGLGEIRDTAGKVKNSALRFDTFPAALKGEPGQDGQDGEDGAPGPPGPPISSGTAGSLISLQSPANPAYLRNLQELQNGQPFNLRLHGFTGNGTFADTARLNDGLQYCADNFIPAFLEPGGYAVVQTNANEAMVIPGCSLSAYGAVVMPAAGFAADVDIVTWKPKPTAQVIYSTGGLVTTAGSPLIGGWTTIGASQVNVGDTLVCVAGFAGGLTTVVSKTANTVTVDVNASTSLAGTAGAFIVRPVSMGGSVGNSIHGLGIHPQWGVTKLGRYNFACHATYPTGTTLFEMRDCILNPGLDYSLFWENDSSPQINLQGSPALSWFIRNYFGEGMKLANHGDSLSVLKNTIRGTNGRRLDLTTTDGLGGYGSQTEVAYNNIVCSGGIRIGRGREVNIHDNNIEHNGAGWAGSGSHGAVIDFDGTEGAIYRAKFNDNLLSIHQVDAAYGVTALVRFNNVEDGETDGNTYYNAEPFNRYAVRTTPLAKRCVPDGGTNSYGGLLIPCFDAGVNTKGLMRPTLFVNGSTQVAGEDAAGVFIGVDGRVTVSGVINLPATPSGSAFLYIADTLGLPAKIKNFACRCLAGGVAAAGFFHIDPATQYLVWDGPSNATQAYLNHTYTL